MKCVSCDICVYHLWFVFFPGAFLSSRVTGACPVATDLVILVNVRTQQQRQNNNNNNNNNNKNNNNNHNNNEGKELAPLEIPFKKFTPNYHHLKCRDL